MKNDTLNQIPTLRSPVLSPTHSNRWQLLIENQELLGLQKEIIHLERKSQERDLSDWELKRLEEVRQQLSETELDTQLSQ